jgi:cysteine synthase A
MDEIVTVTDSESLENTRELMEKEGIFVGISSGAAFCVAKKIAIRKENREKTIVVLFADSAERYLSTPLFTGEK